MAVAFILVLTIVAVGIYIHSQMPDSNDQLLDNIKKLDKNGITKNKGKGKP